MMEKMLNDETEAALANILYKYIKHGGLSNEKFVFDCLSAIRELNDLNSYLNHLIFKDMGKKTYASYNYSKKTITINKRKLNDFFTHDKLEKKLSVLNTVLHETSHVFQSKKIEQDNDLEVKLLKSEDDFEKSNSFNHLFWKLIYNYLYLSLPSERLAIYNSYDSMINILKILRPHNISRYIDDCEIDCFLHLDNYVYKKNDYYSPFEKYAYIHDKVISSVPLLDEEFFDLLSKTKLSLKENFIYGFPIKENECNNLFKINLFK